MTGPITRVTCPICGGLFARRRDGTPFVHRCPADAPAERRTARTVQDAPTAVGEGNPRPASDRVPDAAVAVRTTRRLRRAFSPAKMRLRATRLREGIGIAASPQSTAEILDYAADEIERLSANLDEARRKP